MPRSILVTGGAGFIGSHFVARHWADHEVDRVIVLDALTYAGRLDRLPREVRISTHFEFVHGNITDDALVASLLDRVDTVVHFAAETHVPRSIADNRVFVETDILGTQVLLNGIVERADRIERMIHISSSEVYGSALEASMTEEHPLRPTTPYAAAKCGADRLVFAFAETYGVPAVILRPFNNFGPGQHLEKAIARFITCSLLGEPIVIHGSGEASRDWLFVEDTCRAIELALGAPIATVCGEVFNVGTGVATSVRSLVEMIVGIVGTAPPPILYSSDRPGQVDRHCADTTTSERILGFRAAIDLHTGLEKTCDWYASHRDWWSQDLEMRSVAVRDRDGSISHW